MALRDVLKDLATNVGKAALDTIQKAAFPPSKDAKEPDDVDQEGDDVEGGDDASANLDDGEDAEALTDDTGDAVDTSDQEMPQSPLSAIHGERDDQGAALEKIPDSVKDIEMARSDPKSIFWDPYAVIDALGYKDRPTPMTYATLRAMVWKMPILQAIVRTRVNQVSSFAMPQVDKYSTGYRVRLRDLKAKPTPASEARSQQLERWLMTTGATEHPEGRDDFETFLAKITQDSMIFDQFCFEIVPSRKGSPAEFYAVDAATIRIADTTKLFVDPEDMDVVRYVQIYDGLVVAEYTANQLCFGIRNPSSNIRLQGYGQSELEMLIGVVTAMLWGMDYNMKFFSQGATAKGVLNFQGQVPEKQLRAFRRHWYSMVAGIENAWRTPIMNAEQGMQWVDIQKSNKDMEFSAWFDFLIKIASSIYQMDPMEVNFKYGTEGGKAMFESNNTAKLTASKDRGLKPLLRTIQRKISTHLITAIDPDFEFEFVGLDTQTPGDQADLNMKLVKSLRTIDELRALDDLPPLPNGMGDIILDPVYLQHMTSAGQQAQGTGAFAPPPDPNAEQDPDDPFASLQGELESGSSDDDGKVSGGGGQPPQFQKKGDAPAEADKPAKALPAEKSRKSPGKDPLMKAKPRFTLDIDL